MMDVIHENQMGGRFVRVEKMKVDSEDRGRTCGVV